MCRCTPGELRSVGLDAPWRTQSLSHFDLLRRIQDNGITLSPLFSCPWIKSDCFRVDWLHSADQGIAADFIGNLFYYLVKTKMPGANEKAKCAALWKEVQDLYTSLGIADRLQNLVITMLKKPAASASPKLRSSAAQCRAMVGVAKQLADRHLDPADPEEMAMGSGMSALHQCYMSLSGTSIFWQDVLPVQSRLFAAQFVALESRYEYWWRVKPKLHLFLHMCDGSSKPAMCWTYRDEDFGGSCAQWARRRGGLQKPSSTSKNLLVRFRMKQDVPRLV